MDEAAVLILILILKDLLTQHDYYRFSLRGVLGGGGGDVGQRNSWVSSPEVVHTEE